MNSKTRDFIEKALVFLSKTCFFELRGDLKESARNKPGEGRGKAGFQEIGERYFSDRDSGVGKFLLGS